MSRDLAIWRLYNLELMLFGIRYMNNGTEKNVMRHLIFCVSFQAGQKAQLQTQCWLLLSDCTLILHICDYPFDCCVNCHCSSCFHCWQGLVVYQSYGIACGHVHCQTNLLIWC
jgi:hypothetical protein